MWPYENNRSLYMCCDSLPFYELLFLNTFLSFAYLSIAFSTAYLSYFFSLSVSLEVALVRASAEHNVQYGISNRAWNSIKYLANRNCQCIAILPLY